MFKVGDVFTWGNANKAVVVKVLDEEKDTYYCVYHQNKLKYVVAEFHFSNGEWNLSDESGRQIQSGEWAQYVRNIK